MTPVCVFSDRHHKIFADWKAVAEAKRGSDPISYAELTLITWDVIKDEDWVRRRGPPVRVRKLWNFDAIPLRDVSWHIYPDRYVSHVGLAYRGTDKLARIKPTVICTRGVWG